MRMDDGLLPTVSTRLASAAPTDCGSDIQYLIYSRMTADVLAECEHVEKNVLRALSVSWQLARKSLT